MTTSDSELLDLLMGHLLVHHPAPWRVERDWSWEVRDAKGHLVAAMPQSESAEDLVALAAKRQGENEAFSREWEASEAGR